MLLYSSLLFSRLLLGCRLFSSSMAIFTAMAYKARELLARRIRALREERGWSQEDLSEASGLHRTYIGAIERAERNMGIDNLESFAKAFKISIAELFRE